MSDGIKLQVLTRRSSERPTPLVLVHGAYSAAQQWVPLLLPSFAERSVGGARGDVRGRRGEPAWSRA